MFKTLIIAKQAEQLMYKDATASFPNECCGFFYGQETDTTREVTLAIPVNNSKKGDQGRRFEISAFDYMKAERYAITNNLTLLGVYHSHPNHPAVPSIHDLKVAMPYFSYIIISVMDGKINVLRSWQLKETVREFGEEEVLVPAKTL